MVKFEVLESIDEERVGSLTIFYEYFSLGSSNKVDLRFDDSSIVDNHLQFTLQENGLLIKSQSPNFYFSNGKKVIGSKRHKVNDEIQVGSTKLKIISLEFQNLSIPFSDIYNKRLQENPELEQLIIQLQKELLYLESKKDV